MAKANVTTTKVSNVGQTILAIQSEMPESVVLSYDSSGNPDSGKPGLPEPVPESDHDYYEDDADENKIAVGTEKEVTFSEKDQKDFNALEARITAGKRQAFESLREIRCRQLWRLALDGQGKQLYSSFDSYCEDRWGHTRQWVTHGTNWLRITEELESLGIPGADLTVKAAQGLLFGRLNDAGGLRLVLEEAKEDGVPMDRDHLREILLRRADYNSLSRDGREGYNKPAAQNYAAYKKDVAVAEQLGESGVHSLFDEAAKAARNESLQGTGLADALVMISQQERQMPDRNRLLANFTGPALEELVERLQGVALEMKAIAEKKILLRQHKEEIKSLQAGTFKSLKDQARALESELVAVGAIMKKGKKQDPSQDNDGRGIPDQDDGNTQGDQEEDVSEVRLSLADALAAMDLALEAEWPDDPDELNEILLAAQHCQAKLAEISGKVNGLLAAVKVPESIPSGDTT